MSNQEVFDAYAERVSEQNSQIREAVTVILQEIGRLQGDSLATNEKPLDTAKMEQALQQLTASVDEVEAIHTVEAPVEEAAPVEAEVEAADDEPVEVVEEATTDAADEDSDEE